MNGNFDQKQQSMKRMITGLYDLSFGVEVIHKATIWHLVFCDESGAQKIENLSFVTPRKLKKCEKIHKI
jgi:hypothetical protein